VSTKACANWQPSLASQRRAQATSGGSRLSSGWCTVDEASRISPPKVGAPWQYCPVRLDQVTERSLQS
jgi:hypothetical protein